jgi:uncharacterized membrane protein YtjA (UPF0391 family)
MKRGFIQPDIERRSGEGRFPTGRLRVPRAKGRVVPILLANEGGENIMLSWALTFLVIALIAGLLGFAGIAGAAAGIAKILFVVFLVLFLVSLIAGRGRPPIA